MEVSPPYLLHSGDGEQQRRLSFACDIDAAVTEMAVHGRWTQRLGVEIFTGLGKSYAERPHAVIADLHDLADPNGSSAPLWFAGRRAGAAVEPPVELVLCLPPATGLAGQLTRLGGR